MQRPEGLRASRSKRSHWELAIIYTQWGMVRMCWRYLYLVMGMVLEAVEVLARLHEGRECLGCKKIEIKLPGLDFSRRRYKQHTE
jgi:hypothetical protein